MWLGGDYLAGIVFSSCCLHGDVLAAFTSLYVLQWCHSKNHILGIPSQGPQNCHCASLRQWETGYTMVWLNHDVIMCLSIDGSPLIFQTGSQTDTKIIFVSVSPITFLVFYPISASYLLFQG